MIVDLPDTTTNAINHKLVHLRNSGGAVAIGRVLTLVLVTDEFGADKAIAVANDASREHPCRVLTIARGNKRGASRLDAQIRVGGDAGASEVIVLRLFGPLADHGESVIVPLLLPDAPIVVWWPGVSPEVPIEDRIGQMGQRRITDAAQAKSPMRALMQLAGGTAPGDTDLAWSRITRWRALLAAALDQPPYEDVTRAIVTGASDSPSTELMAGWLAFALKCPVTRKKTAPGTGMVGVTLIRPSGKVSLERPDGTVGTLTQPGQPVRRIAMPRRSDVDCLTEELRRLDPDELFADVLTKGLAELHPTRFGKAEADGEAAEAEPAPAT
jgi:glucose-6-phosphate dehydrogenase assembly protein OpcA